MERVQVNKVLQLFNQLSKAEQLEAIDRINKQTFEDRWKLIDHDLPEADMADDEIMQEVRSVCYGEETN